jgi:hypothetical protein
VRDQAHQAALAVSSLGVVVNASPLETTGIAVTLSLADVWQSHPNVVVETVELESSLGLKHDFIDPADEQPVDGVAVVYPRLLEQIHRPAGE